MVIIQILKRKDAAAVILGIVIALIVSTLLPALVSDLATTLSGLEDGQAVSYSAPGAGWQGQYLHPIVFAALQLIALELLVRLYIAVNNYATKK